jgi:hypothetical protein
MALAGQVGSHQSARKTCRPPRPYKLEQARDAAFPSRKNWGSKKEVLSGAVETIAREYGTVNDENAKNAAV